MTKQEFGYIRECKLNERIKFFSIMCNLIYFILVVSVSVSFYIEGMLLTVVSYVYLGLSVLIVFIPQFSMFMKKYLLPICIIEFVLLATQLLIISGIDKTYIILCVCSWGILFAQYIIHYVIICKEKHKVHKQQSDFYKEFNDIAFRKTIAKVIYLNDNYTYDCENNVKKSIQIGKDYKKIAFADYDNGDVVVFNTSEVVGYEIYENCVDSINVAFPFVFCAIDKFKRCKELKLIIKTTSLEVPQICYDIIFDTYSHYGISVMDKTYIECLKTLQEATSFFDTLLANNKKESR